jgi:AcrR family transcriptional regulator
MVSEAQAPSPLQGRTRSPAPSLGTRALRTRTLLIDTARELFLHRGYGGARIDDIVDAAGVSRASFYTYFPSKKDLLLAIGADSYADSRTVADQLAQVPEAWTRPDILQWVSSYVDFMDKHGAFVIVWTQAAWDDDELRVVGLRVQMATARRLGQALQTLQRTRAGSGDPALEGLAVTSLLQRLWQFWQGAKAPFSRDQVVDILTDMLVAWLERS